MLSEVKTYTFEDFLKFYERLGESGGFEFSDGLIWDKFAGKPVEESIIDFILSDNFNVENLLFFQTMPTQKHDDLLANLMFFLASMLKEKGFAIYPQKTAIAKNSEDGFREPDLVIVNWKEQKRNKYHQVLNPVMLVEVLSKSTKHIDLGEKVLEYQAIPSLQTYLIIWQDEPKAVIYTRKAEKVWEERIYESLQETIELTYFDVKLPLKQVYENINFE
ncbi:Uma2 family endonuclease [Raineya orbicola]|jgi:Uma2 family endonuclease|uniref:Putative restriction endonuclease n=1 Tax=Raineya orbicola TaxID=2016530 RepID=A0A2N3IHU1_9BACT|nr:Uma2 family endonuclease [Raineya orbicola]PKQ69793.1 putative restriction endonuclease [Raineya orbicola]